MAKEERKGSRVWEIITKDYPAERILMGILGVIVIVFGVYIIGGVSNPDTAWLRIQNTDGVLLGFLFGSSTRILIFAWFIILVGTLSFGMAVWPFVQPSISEMKRVSWPTNKVIRNHSARVYGFILFLVVMFLVYELIWTNVFAALRG